jgi:hypothetical protein
LGEIFSLSTGWLEGIRGVVEVEGKIGEQIGDDVSTDLAYIKRA